MSGMNYTDGFDAHRFVDSVAFHCGDCDMLETVYLSVLQARKLALALLTLADDIDNCPKFSESNMATIRFPNNRNEVKHDNSA